MQVERYDAVIIGFGKAGKTLAATLGKAGWSVALIEQSAQMYGGTCINIACIPTKTLLHDATIAPAPAEDMQERYATAIERKNGVTSLLRGKNFANVDDLSTVTVITGHARFTGSHELEITGGNDVMRVQGERLFINTGTEPSVPPIEGETGARVYTSTSLMELTELPDRLVVVGGGNVGLEFATMYRGFGSEVTVLVRGASLLDGEEPEIVAAVLEVLEDLGVRVVFGADVHRIEDLGATARVVYHEDSGEAGIEAEAVLLAVGRTPVTRDLGLEAAGVTCDERGYVVVNDRLQTSAEHIWAMGDVNGGPQFTYISLDDYRIVKDHLLGDGTRTRADRQAVPSTIFVDPPFARVGMTEQEAREAGHTVSVATLPVAAIPRARVNNDTRGVLKAVVDAESKRVLGVALFCTNAEEMINIVALAMALDQEYGVLRDRIFTHPTMSESLNDLFTAIDG